MGLLEAIRECFTGKDDADYPVIINEKNTNEISSMYTREEGLASSILLTLFTAEKQGHDLDRRLQNMVSSCGWYEGLARRILDGLVDALKSGAAMGGAIKEAFDRATAVASELVHEHPVFAAVVATVIAIGILVILAPWAIEALGFGELGPVEGELSSMSCRKSCN